MKTISELFESDPADPATWANPYELHKVLGLKPWQPCPVSVWHSERPADDGTAHYMSWPEVRALLDGLHAEWQRRKGSP